MLKLVLHPNEALNKCLPEFDFTLNAEEIASQLVELMIKENGRGISANQAGLDYRVLAIKTEIHPATAPIVMFNPIVLNVSEEVALDYEGCLSFPGLFFKVKRPVGVQVRYLDYAQKECIIILEGIDARAFLHELDHLNGICFIDRISKMKLNIAMKKQRKINGRTK